MFELLVIFFLNSLYGVEVSSCERQNNLFSVSFNNSFKIENIGYDGSVRLPYDIYGKKKFMDIFIYSRGAYSMIESALKNCSFDISKSFEKPDYKIFDIKKLKSQKRIANAVISFDDDINVVFGVVKKNNYYIIYPPDNFKFIDDEFKKQVYYYISNYFYSEGR